MKFAQDLEIRIDKIIWARSRVFYMFWHKFYARHMLPYTILWQMYYKSMIRMIRAEAQIPQVQMDGCSLVPNCFSAFGFESLTQSNFCIFVSRCFGMRCKGRGQVGAGREHMRTASWTIIASNDLFPTDPSEGLSIKWTAPAAHAKKNNVKEKSKEKEEK